MVRLTLLIDHSTKSHDVTSITVKVQTKSIITSNQQDHTRSGLKMYLSWNFDSSVNVGYNRRFTPESGPSDLIRQTLLKSKTRFRRIRWVNVCNFHSVNLLSLLKHCIYNYVNYRIFSILLLDVGNCTPTCHKSAIHGHRQCSANTGDKNRQHQAHC